MDRASGVPVPHPWGPFNRALMLLWGIVEGSCGVKVRFRI